MLQTLRPLVLLPLLLVPSSAWAQQAAAADELAVVFQAALRHLLGSVGPASRAWVSLAPAMGAADGESRDQAIRTAAARLGIPTVADPAQLIRCPSDTAYPDDCRLPDPADVLVGLGDPSRAPGGALHLPIMVHRQAAVGDRLYIEVLNVVLEPAKPGSEGWRVLRVEFRAST